MSRQRFTTVWEPFTNAANGCASDRPAVYRLPMKRLLVALLALAGLAHAAESPDVRSERATVTLVSDTDRVAPGQTFRAGLRFRLAPGWHTYWGPNPGDAGTAAEIAWSLSEGASAGEIAWPAPHRIPFGPTMSYGYETEIVLPVQITAPQALNGPLVIEASANWLVCEKICVPEEGVFRLSLPAGPPATSAQAPLFAASDATLPQPSPWKAHAAEDGTLTVAGEGISPAAIRDAYFFPAAWGAIDHAAPQRLSVADGRMTLALAKGPQYAPAALSGVLQVQDGAGMTVNLALAAEPGPALPVRPAIPLWQALLLALAGGVLLNLMPCVFPVLAMKAMAIAKLSGAAREQVRAHALSYTAGVLVTFLALGGALVAARAAGAVAGWGFQFTSPAFVTLAAWTMVAVGLSLSGVFHVGGGFAGTGQSLATRGGHAGSFFTGMLAVIVASPCTAPFMAAALGAALAMSPAAALAVFGAIGLGLAAPYAALAAFPRLAALLPRPGAWMDRLKQALAFPMYGAAVWLVWVLSQQAGPTGVLVAGAGIVLIAFAAWAWGTGGRVFRVAALAGAAAALALLPGLSDAQPPGAAVVADGRIEPFSEARLAELRAEGRPVFVNMTAAWCVSCLVNERVALSTDGVTGEFARRNIAYLKGDWTRQDPAITAFLRAHGRDGVPLYLYYAPGAREPVELPQLLTEGIVLEAIGTASVAARR